MKKVSRIFLFGALSLILLAACTGTEGQESPTAAATIVPGDQTVAPPALGTEAVGTQTTEMATTATPALGGTAGVDLTATIPTATSIAGAVATDTTQTASIPVTGADLVLLECQFCIQDAAHALLVLPDTATFETVADTATLSTPGPEMGCNTVDTYNGRQVVICRSQENTSLNLNICVDGNNCTQLLVELQSCPDAGAAQPGTIDTPGAVVPTNTPGVGLPTNTAGAGITDTPAVVAPTATP